MIQIIILTNLISKPEYNSKCLLYDIEKNILEDTNFNFPNFQELEMYPFPETHQYALVFYKEESIIYKRICEEKFDSEIMLIFLDKNLNPIEVGSNYEIIIPLPECSEINSFSLVYSIIVEKYNIIYDCKDSTSGNLTINYFLSIFSADYTNYYLFLLNSSDDSISNMESPTTYLSYKNYSNSSINFDLSSETIFHYSTSFDLSTDTSTFYDHSTDIISEDMAHSDLSTNNSELFNDSIYHISDFDIYSNSFKDTSVSSTSTYNDSESMPILLNQLL